jgi:hypothetical protein
VPDPAADEVGSSFTARHPLFVYTTLRLVLFAVPLLILLAVQVELVWALLIAAILSSILSIFVLGRYRDQLSMSLSDRNERMRQRMVERETAEDAWDDSRRATDGVDHDPDESAGGSSS